MKRKNIIGIISIACGVAAMSAMQSCCREDEPAPQELTLSLTPSSQVMSFYLQKELTLGIQPTDARYDRITWAAEPAGIVDMTYHGQEDKSTGVKLTSRSTGTTTITATVSSTQDGLKTEKSVSAKVTVADAFFETKSAGLMVGEETDIKVVTTPDGLQDSVLSWTSSAPDIVSVDAKGHIKALRDGKATVSASFISKPLTMDVEVSTTLVGISDIYATPSTCEVAWSLDSKKDITEKGLCWCEGDGPATVDDNVITEGSGAGSVTTLISGLSEYSHYALRLYYKSDGQLVYGPKSTFTTAREKWSYVDEWGQTWYGVEINGIVWAPFPCGYRKPDASGKGYPYGKLYQMARPQGHGRGEAVWNDPSDHTKGGHFIDENGLTVKLVYGHCDLDKTKADEFYFNDTPFYYTDSQVQPTETEFNGSTWYLNNNQYGSYFDIVNPCPEGWVNADIYDFFNQVYLLSELEVHNVEGRIILTEGNYDDCAQGIWFDAAAGGYRSPDGEIHTIEKDNAYQKIWGSYISREYRPWDAMQIASHSHCEMTPDGPKYFKTYNGASAMSVRCRCNK